MGVIYGILSLCLVFVALQTSHCATVLVDGVTKWSDRIANIGDTVIFKHNNQYNLYIFRTKEAYSACNFSQAVPLSNHNSTTYTWHLSRPGNFYFAFYNGTIKPCQQEQKLAVAVRRPSNSPSPTVQSANSPENAPPATSGGVVSSSPAYPWPFQPRKKAAGPAVDFGVLPPALAPAGLPGNVPFATSNPAVPLPTGEVDSTTVGPLPTAANHAPQGDKAFRFIQGLLYLCCVFMVTI